MTDRYFALTVLLDKDIREDDAKPIIEAIQMIKHVQTVEPHINNLELWAAQERTRREFGEKLWKVLYPKMGRGSE